MSVLAVKERDRTGARRDRSLVTTYTRHFAVEMEVGTTDPQILWHPSIPRPYDPHPDDPFAYAVGPSINRENGRLAFVEVEYSSQVDAEERQKQRAPANPLDRPAVVEIFGAQERVAITTDGEGNRITNTAGDLLEGLEGTEKLLRLEVVKNVPAVPLWIQEYIGAVNKDSVRCRGVRWPKETLRVEDFRIPDTEYENGQDYIPFQITLLYRKKTWREEFLNYGRRERVEKTDPSTGETYEELVPILVDGEPTQDPLPLDENGRAYRKTNSAGLSVIDFEVPEAEIQKNLRKHVLGDLLPFSKLPLE